MDPNTKEDFKKYVNASGGRALRGLGIFGFGSQSELGSAPVIELPETADIFGSNQPMDSEIYMFSSTEQSKRFYQRVTSDGWSISSKASGTYIVSVSASAEHSEEKKQTLKKELTKKVKSVVISESYYVPKKSFQIPPTQMRLTSSAVEDARRVTNDLEANYFLTKYKSHVSATLFHVGGILMNEVNVRSEKEVTAASLTLQAMDKLKVSVEAGFSNIANIQAEYEKEHQEETQQDESSEVEVEVSETKMRIWGPTSAANKEAFLTMLTEDITTWEVIDKKEERAEDLVPIWELLANQHPELNNAAVLVCAEWQGLVRNLVDSDDRLFTLFERSKKIHASSPPPSTPSEDPSPDDNDYKLPPLPPSVQPLPLPYSIWKRRGLSFFKSESGVTPSITYTQDVVIDRVFHHQLSPDLLTQRHRLEDCLRHRIEAFSVYNSMDDFDISDEEEESGGARPDPDSYLPPLVILLDIFKQSDLLTQVALCSLLLQQRSAAPLVAPDSETQLLQHFADALSFAEVKLPKEVVISLATDITLPRIAFLSTQKVSESLSPTIASGLLQCEFISQYYSQNIQDSGSGAVEVGVGFFEKDDESIPCIALHVISPYAGTVLEFLEEIDATVVLEVETGASSEELSENHKEFGSKFKRFFQWTTGSKNSYSSKTNTLIGSETHIKKKLSHLLTKQKSNQPAQKTLKEACSAHFHPQQGLLPVPPEQLEFDWPNVRSSLLLQQSHKRETDLFFETLRLQNKPKEKRDVEIKWIEEQNLKAEMVESIPELPILQAFNEVLSEKDQESRRAGVDVFQQRIADRMAPILEDVLARKLEAFDILQKHPDSKQAQANYDHAKSLYLDRKLGTDHLWREFCHIFTADPKRQRPLATLAAQHLLDGFPLELLDGDAGMFCASWVSMVLSEVDVLLGKSPRVFVLSTMGVQSSGKSTLFNLMFGTKLQSSTGQCTRGIFMQLVPAYEREEFDYVLILDTEGLKSPEFFEELGVQVRDNRMATFGILAADACVMMVANEEDMGLKEILPEAMLAFKGSVTAEASGGRIRARLMFVYRSVDLNDTSNLHGQIESLQLHLHETAKLVAKIGPGSDQADEDPIMLSDLQINDDEDKSDVKFMGNLTVGSVPPHDTPDWNYGKKVTKLREYIHNRVAAQDGWRATTLNAWVDHLNQVWTCIHDADFQLSFKSAKEYSAWSDLVDNVLNSCYKDLSRQYLTQFDSLTLGTYRNVRDPNDTLQFEKLWKELLASVEETKEAATNKVNESLAEKQWNKWRADEEESWKSFCRRLEDDYKALLKEFFDGYVKFEKEVFRCKEALKLQITKLIKDSSKGFGTKENFRKGMEKEFERIFNNILQEAHSKHRPFAEHVKRAVEKVYQETESVSKNYDLFSPDGPKAPHAMLIKDLKILIDKQLGDARHYSDYLVGSVIKATQGLLSGKTFAWWYKVLQSTDGDSKRKEIEAAHRWTMNTVIEKLQKVQEKWDEENNVGKRLEKEKQMMKDYFDKCADGAEVARLVHDDILHVLQSELVKDSKLQLTESIVVELDNLRWMRSLKNMRPTLDLYLLGLINKKYVWDLLRYVADGKTLYDKVTEANISFYVQELRDGEWQKSVKTVQSIVTDEGAQADIDTTTYTVDKLLACLQERFNSSSMPSIAKAISGIPREHFKWFKTRTSFSSEFNKTYVPLLCKSLRAFEQEILTNQKYTLTDGILGEVRKRMMRRGNKTPLERCAERCPLCGAACFHEYGHSDTKHEALHQPDGLSGVIWERTGELNETSCYQSLQKNYVFKNNDTHYNWRPFNEFKDVYPDWSNPGNVDNSWGLGNKMREYIFYNYQEPLSRKYKVKQCNKIPASYNHTLREIANDLRYHVLTETEYQRLKKVFKQSI